MEISYRNAEENGEYVEVLSQSVISEPLIKMFYIHLHGVDMEEIIDIDIIINIIIKKIKIYTQNKQKN